MATTVAANGNPGDWWVNRVGRVAGATYDPVRRTSAYGAALDIGTYRRGLSDSQFERVQNSAQTATLESARATPAPFGAGVMDNVSGGSGGWLANVGNFIGEWWSMLGGGSPVGTVAKPAAEAAGRGAVRAIETGGRAVATYQGAQNIAVAEGRSSRMAWQDVPDLDTFFDKNIWRRAWEATDPTRGQATSPARATADMFVLSLGLGTETTQDIIARGMMDPSDPDFQAYRATSTPYNLLTGAGDFAYSWWLAPEVLAAKGAGAVSRLSRGATSQMTGAQADRFRSLLTATDDELDTLSPRPKLSPTDRFALKARESVASTRLYIKTRPEEQVLEELANSPFAVNAMQGDRGAAAWAIMKAAKSDDETWRMAVKAATGDEPARDWLRAHQDPAIRDAMELVSNQHLETRKLLAAQIEDSYLITERIERLRKAGLNTEPLEAALAYRTGAIGRTTEEATALADEFDRVYAEYDTDARMRDIIAGAEFETMTPAGREGLLIDAPMLTTRRSDVRSYYVHRPGKYTSRSKVVIGKASTVWKRQPGVIEMHRGDGAFENAQAQLDLLERLAAQAAGPKKAEEVIGADWTSRRADLLDRMSSARTDVERRAAARAIEDESVRRLARAYQIPVTGADDLLEWLHQKRATALEELKSGSSNSLSARSATGQHIWSRAQTVGEDGKKTPIDVFREIGPNGEVVETVLPVAVSQLENYHIMYDLRQLNHMLMRNGDMIKDNLGVWDQTKVRLAQSDLVEDGREVSRHVLDSFNHAWKFATLFRLGYTVRTVTDDSMRAFAAGAGFQQVIEAAYGARQGIRRGVTKSRRRRGVVEPERPGPSFEVVDRAGTKHTVAAALHGRADQAYINATSSRDSLGRFFNVNFEDLHAARREMRGTTSIGDKKYFDEWARVLDGQVLNDPIWSKMIQLTDDADIATWLKTSDEGAEILARHPHYQKGVTTAEDVVEMQRAALLELVPEPVWEYLLRVLKEGMPLDAKALKQIADEQPVPLQAWAPTHIDHAAVALITGRSKVGELYAKATNGAFEILQRIPQDYLVRNPFYRVSYKARMREIVRQYDTEALTPKRMQRIQRDAHEYALTRLKRYLFSLNEDTEFTAMFRHLIPFGAAHAESMRKWSQAFLDNPVGVWRVWGVGWAGIGDMAFVDEVDRDGNPVNDRGFRTDTYLRFRVSEENAWMAPFLRDLFNEAGVAIGQVSKGSTNLLVQGDPFFLPSPGPLVTMPAQVFAVRHPELAKPGTPSEKVYNWLFPVGTPDQAWKLLAPNSLQKALETAQADSAFQATESTVLMQLLGNFRLANGRAPNQREAAELRRRAQSSATWLQRVYVLGAMTLPANIKWLPGDQEFVEMYRKYQESYGPTDGYQKFVEDFGWEYVIYGQSLSTSTNGVPPTLAGHLDYSKNKQVIQSYPDLGRYIVSPESLQDEYLQSVYRFQQSTPTGPGRPERQRSLKDPAGNFEQADVTQGWREYGELKSYVRAELTARLGEGATLNQRGAEDLAEMLRVGRAMLSEKYPAWSAAYGERDTRWGLNFVEQFRAALADMEEKDPGVYAYMPWLAGMRDYIELHDYVSQELEARRQAGGSGTLFSPGSDNMKPVEGNEDLAMVWNTGVSILTSQNPSFATHIYDRALDNWAPVAVNP